MGIAQRGSVLYNAMLRTTSWVGTEVDEGRYGGEEVVADIRTLASLPGPDVEHLSSVVVDCLVVAMRTSSSWPRNRCAWHGHRGGVGAVGCAGGKGVPVGG